MSNTSPTFTIPESLKATVSHFPAAYIIPLYNKAPVIDCYLTELSLLVTWLGPISVPNIPDSELDKLPTSVYKLFGGDTLSFITAKIFPKADKNEFARRKKIVAYLTAQYILGNNLNDYT